VDHPHHQDQQHYYKHHGVVRALRPASAPAARPSPGPQHDKEQDIILTHTHIHTHIYTHTHTHTQHIHTRTSSGNRTIRLSYVVLQNTGHYDTASISRHTHQPQPDAYKAKKRRQEQSRLRRTEVNDTLTPHVHNTDTTLTLH
jgi:hypothetical protein